MQFRWLIKCLVLLTAYDDGLIGSINDMKDNKQKDEPIATKEGQPSRLRKWFEKFKKPEHKEQNDITNKKEPSTLPKWFKKSKKSEQEEKNSDEAVPKKIRWVQIRMIPIWLRIVLIILLLAGVAVIGLRIGYGYVGDENPNDVLKKETWLHIVDIIKGKE